MVGDHAPESLTPPRWRLLRTPPASGACNMAIDEALLVSVREGAMPTLRLYEWSPACLSLGRNQPAVGHYPLRVLQEHGIDVVRRATGGRAVLHQGELTYSVVAPGRALGSPKAAYRLVNQVLVEALGDLGADAGVLEKSARHAPIPSTIPCFADPVPGEVLAGGRKVIGSAQVRIGGILLQHGSILLRRSPLLPLLSAAGVDDLEGEPAYLELLLGYPVSRAVLEHAIVAAWTRSVGALHEVPLDASESRRAQEIASRFADDAWTWRR